MRASRSPHHIKRPTGNKTKQIKEKENENHTKTN